MLPDSQMCIFSNVHIKLKNRINHRVIKEYNYKNRITKYALSGIASMIKGEFNDISSYINIDEYVPKYLALGTNIAGEDSNVTVTGNVTANDTMLLNEITANGSLLRVRLEDVKRNDSSLQNDYIRISYRTLVTSGLVKSDERIQELGLFTNNTDKYNGLWARVTTSEPITIPDNSALDITWDIVLASSGVGIYPTSVDIVPSSAPGSSGEITINQGSVEVLTANLKSSVIDSSVAQTAGSPVYKDVTYKYCEWTESLEDSTVELDKLGTITKFMTSCSIKNESQYAEDKVLYITVKVITGLTDTIKIIFKGTGQARQTNQ